jgi:hypothetical protein
MNLSQIVKRFPDGPIPGGTIADNGRTILLATPPPAQVGIACHQATVIWLYKAAHGVDIFPDLDVILGAQETINGLLRFGNPKRVSASRPPEASDVLIFAGDNDHALHSCVTIRGGVDGTIGGYNQQNWFSGPVPILQNDYSVYRVDQIKWAEKKTIFSKQRAFDNADNTKLKLWAVRGATAAGRL